MKENSEISEKFKQIELMTILKSVQEYSGKRYAWEFFREKTSRPEVIRRLTGRINKNKTEKQDKICKNYNYPFLCKSFANWQKYDLLESEIISEEIIKKTIGKNGKIITQIKRKKINKHRLKITPLFIFAEFNYIKFNNFQKNILESLFSIPEVRKEIYDSNKKRILGRGKASRKWLLYENLEFEDDIVIAMIKFYFNHFFLRFQLPDFWKVEQSFFDLVEIYPKVTDLRKNKREIFNLDVKMLKLLKLIKFFDSKRFTLTEKVHLPKLEPRMKETFIPVDK